MKKNYTRLLFCWICLWSFVLNTETPGQDFSLEGKGLPAVGDELQSIERRVAKDIVKEATAEDVIPEEELVQEKTKPVDQIIKKKYKKELIRFDFENEDLVNVINKFAALQNTNIILPYGAQAINQKITFHLGKKISLEEAERFLDTFLDIAGYTKVPHGDFYTIVKIDPNVTRETLPLYVGVSPQDLPASGRIQVVYYFQNLKVPESSQGTDPLNIIFNDMLSVNRNYTFDTKANAVIIADKASNIKAAMTMLLELDSMGIHDVVRKLQLYHASATTLAPLLQQQIVAVTGDTRGRLRADVKSEAGLFFAPGTKIIADPQSNALLIMGKEPAVNRMVDFINEYLDVPTEEGRSILHYYDCQYLDAEPFAEVLRKVVGTQGRSGQATDQQQSGPNRSFEGVIIAAETLVKEEVKKSELALAKEGESVLKGTVVRGGNRIIVAAKWTDWERIEKLMKELDKPQLQIIIQVMIVDFTANKSKIFGMQTRNPSTMRLPDGVNFQAANLASPVLSPYTNGTPTTLATDLLMLIGGTLGGTSPTPPAQSLAQILSSSKLTIPGTNTTGDPGSLIFSLADPAGTGIWTFLQWLNAFGELKVLSHPYLVVLNNQKGEESLTQTKRLQGQARTGEGGAIVSEIDDVPASLKVSIVPRASSIDRLNLQISIKIDQFEGTQGNIASRELHTNANLGSGQMLVLGGLSIIQQSDEVLETPLLGKIPVIGWLFSNKSKASTKTNLAVFIIPTIVEPKIRTGLNKYSKDRIARAYEDVESGALFEQYKDPVNYLFFKDRQNESVEMYDEYLSESRGNFVRPPKRRGPRGPQKPEEQGQIVPPEAHQLKVMLATESNPVLSVKNADPLKNGKTKL